jgi:hypothetical protein
MTLASKLPHKTREKWRWARAFGCSVSAAALLLCALPAHAEDAETRTEARDLATQGAQAFDAGHYDQASDFFQRAYELVKAPSIALMQARSLAKLGQLLGAIDVYERTARTKLAKDAPDAYVKAVETARAEVEEVRRRVPHLKLTLTGVGTSENPVVTIDDKPTPAALLGVERPIDPGTHHVVVVVSGQPRATRQLDLDEGKSYAIEIDTTAAPAVEVAKMPDNSPISRGEAINAPPGTGAAPSPTSGPPTRRILGYVGLGVGALGLGLGTYTGLVALHHKSQLDDVCHPGCPQSSAADLSGFRNNRTVSWVSYGIGVAAATTGILLLTLGEPNREHVALGVVPGGVRVGGLF